MNKRNWNRIPVINFLAPTILIAASSGLTPAHAHHSYAKFEVDRVIEIKGVLTEIRWVNPHVEFTLRGTDANGDEQLWLLETNSPGILRRNGIESGLVKEGDLVKVAGNPAHGGVLEINATNLLLPDGRELLLNPRGSLRFAEQRAANGEDVSRITEGDSSRPDLGIFRTWSSTAASKLLVFPDQSNQDFGLLDYPFTDEARRAVEAFDPIEGSRRLASDCTPKGMPWIMEQPYDISFEEDGSDILFKLEEFDTVRKIHMNWTGNREEQPFSILGFSTGVWENSSLVVTTTNLNSPNFKFEIPASTKSTIVESFTPHAAGDQLDYRLVVTDPEVFTEPVIAEKFWIYIPSQAFNAYNCGRTLTE